MIVLYSEREGESVCVCVSVSMYGYEDYWANLLLRRFLRRTGRRAREPARARRTTLRTGMDGDDSDWRVSPIVTAMNTCGPTPKKVAKKKGTMGT